MVEVEELVVAAKPEGIGDTRAELESLEGAMDEVGGGLEDTVGGLEGLERRFTGAMSAILVGLGAATAGLLAQVPVIQELMTGLGSVIDAIAFRLDQQLRPAIEPIVNGLFNLSEAIFEVDGPLGELVDTFLVFATVAGTIGGVVGGLSLAFGALAGAVGTVSTPILAVVGAISALIAVWTTDFLGIKSAMLTFFDSLKKSVGLAVDGFKALAKSIGAIASFTLSVADTGLEMLEDVLDGAAGFASDIWGFLQDMAGFFLNVADMGLQALQATLMGAKNFAENALETLREIADSTFEAIVEITAKLQEEIFGFGEPGGGALGTGGTAENPGFFRGLGQELSNGESGGNFSLAEAGTRDVNVNIDGRRVVEETGEYPYTNITSR